MKKFIVILCIFFICGVISADICIENLMYSNVLLELDIYREYANAGLAFRDVFWNILYERAKLVLFLLLLCFTPMREYITVLFLSVFSFLWGFFFMSCVAELGLVGVVIAITGVIPHGILYMGIWFLILHRNAKYTYHQRDRVVFGSVTYVAVILLFLTGCIIESLMGTHFIPWVIRLGLV